MKKIKYILTSLLTVLICFNVFSFYVYASSTPTYFNTTHFQMTQSHDSYNIINQSANSGATFTVNTLNFNTRNADSYKGIITLSYTYNSINANANLSNWEILCDGCVINALNNSGGTLKIQTYGNTSFSVTLIHRDSSGTGTGLSDPFTFTSMAESSVSVVTDPVATNTSSIDTKLTTTNSTLTIIQGKLDTANANLSSIITNTNDIETYLNQQDNGTYYDTDIETLLSGCKTELNGIYNYTTLNEALLNNIAGSIGSLSNVTNGEDIVTCINSIKNSQTSLVTNINNIYSLLGTVTQNQTSIINKLTSMGADLTSIASTISSVNTTTANIYSAILSMKTTLEGYEQYIDNIEGLISSQNSLITNIDNTLDTITWNNYTVSSVTISSDFDGNNTISAGYYGNANTPIYYRFKLNAINSNNNSIVKITTQARNGGTLEKAFTAKLYYNNANTLICEDVYINTNYRGTVIYFDTSYLDVVSSTTYILEIKPIVVNPPTSNQKIYLNGTGLTVQYIKDTDIEFWSLKQYFNQYNELNRIYNILSLIEDNQIDYSTYIDEIENLLSAIQTNTSINYTSILNNIESEVDGVEELLGILTAALSIEGAGLFAEIAAGIQEIVAALTFTNGDDTLSIFDLLELISDKTINYTALLTAITGELQTMNTTETNIYNKLLELLQALNVNVDTETHIVQYNTDQHTISDIESSLTTLFNRTEPYVDSMLTPLDNQTFFDKLSNNSKLFDYIFRGVFDTDDSLEVSGTVTNPIFLLVIFAGVFLALVG